MSDATEARLVVLDALVAGCGNYFPTLVERVALLAHGRVGDEDALDAIHDLFAEKVLGWGSSLRGVAFGGVSMASAPFFRIRNSKVLVAHRVHREREQTERGKASADAWIAEQFAKEAAK